MNECTEIRERFFSRGALDRGDPDLERHLAACESCRSAARGLDVVDRALADLPPAFSPPPFEAIAGAAAKAARGQRRRQALRRKLPFLLTGLAAAAAAGVVGLFLAGPSATHGPQVPTLAPGAALASGAGGARQARLESGAMLRLDSGAVRLASHGGPEERLHLDAGAVALEVPKLPAGHSLVVSTPDAEVRVHGTRFQVVRDGEGTRVTVSEGRVEVRSLGADATSRLLSAGESAAVPSAAAHRRHLREAAQAALDAGDYASARRSLQTLLEADLAPVERAEAHALLAWSLAASGQRRDALERYRQALALLPDGERPLWADNAAAELALLLEQEAPEAAPAAWRDYLERFPDGVHASQARARPAMER